MTMSDDDADFAAALEQIANDLDFQGKNCSRPNHLWNHLYHAGVKAGRIAFQVIHDEEACLRDIKHFCTLFRRPTSDDRAYGFWKTIVVARLASGWPTRVNSDASAFDHPAPKVDEEGNLLGRDGVISKLVQNEDGSGHRDRPVAFVTDDYDEVDSLEHQRMRAINYRDACRVLGGLIANGTSKPVAAAEQRPVGEEAPEAPSGAGGASGAWAQPADQGGGGESAPNAQTSGANGGPWLPPVGYVGVKAFCGNHDVPRTTVQSWAEKDKKVAAKHPTTSEDYYSEEWLEARRGKWKRRGKRAPNKQP